MASRKLQQVVTIGALQLAMNVLYLGVVIHPETND